jgi:hypothetical protein
VSDVKAISLSLIRIAGIVGFAVIIMTFNINAHQTSASVALPSYDLSNPNTGDPRLDAYDGCMSRLTDKMPKDKAASNCYDYVYGDREDKTDLPSHESASPEMVPKGEESETGDRSEDGSEDGNGDRQESEEQTTDEEQGGSDAKTDESDEPEDQIMVIEGGKKVAKY